MSTTETVPVETCVLSSEQNQRSLSRNHHSKTLDIGLNGSTVSTNPLGDILQLTCFHPIHGIIVACPFAQFDGNRFHDSAYVREYRSILLNYVRSGKPGFGIHIEGTASKIDIGSVTDNLISISYSVENINVKTNIFVRKGGEVVQSTALQSNSKRPVKVDYALALNVSINRASYGQLTEGGPIPIPPSRNELRLSEDTQSWAVINPNLDAIVQGTLFCNGLPVCLGSGSDMSPRVALEAPLDAAFHGSLDVLPGQTFNLTSTFHLRSGTVISKISAPPQPIPSIQDDGWHIQNEAMSMIVKGNLAYILGNCTIPVGNDSTCFITDHVALPLGWNRDNFWQIRYLLDVFRNIHRFADTSIAHEYHQKIQSVVRQHLNWVFRLAQRPNGYWHRSYLATGVPKDGPVFQLDQQCYPILELCDFFESFPSESAFSKSILDEETISSVLSVLEAHKDPLTSLYMTDETPGDDAVDHPFHFSSHVLLWYTFTRLSRLLSTLDYSSSSLNPTSLQKQAFGIRQSILKHFVAHNPATRTTMFAYLTDGADIHTFYHDANDIPTLFIPSWNFAAESSPEYDLWKRTMDFGISATNTEGFFPTGPFGGLGSVHTRGPWPLGYAQEFIYASMRNDEAAVEDAWRRIQGSMFWDGMFSEAVDAQTGDCMSKAWFSWPGSVIGSALLKYGVPAGR